eukprot:4215288-Pyramimonas_sp.AAC.1
MQDPEHPCKICDELELPLFPGHASEPDLDPWAWHIWTGGRFAQGRRLPKRIEPKAEWDCVLSFLRVETPQLSRSNLHLQRADASRAIRFGRPFLGAVRRANGAAEIA